jgi:hypothetical protein
MSPLASPTAQGCLGGVIGIVLAIVLIMAASPFLNWTNGYGFTWIF